MALIKIANLILLLGLLAGSTDAFAKPRARVARGGASSSKARDAVLLNWLLANSSLSADGSRKLDIRPGRYPGRPGDDLPLTKPKPLAVELAVDVGIVAATLGLFRRAGFIRARDCGPRVVLAARLFFAVANSILIALYASALRYARRLPASPVVVQDISFMEDRMRKSLVKIAVVLGLHLKFDLMPPLIVFSLVHFCVQTKILRRVRAHRRVDLHAIDAIPARWRGGAGSSPLDRASTPSTAVPSPRNDLVHWVAQPLWWDKETSYYRKYGLGRNGGPRAFGVARNIWIYTKEFMMPKKL